MLKKHAGISSGFCTKKYFVLYKFLKVLYKNIR